MSMKTDGPKVAACVHGASEKAKREARKTIQANIARIEAEKRGTNAGTAPDADVVPHREPAPGTQSPPGPGASPRTAGGKKARGEKKPAAKNEAEPAKPAAKAKPAKTPKAKRLSCIDAAAQVIGKDPIGCKDLIAEMGQRGLWKSPGGKTPDASLYAAIIREIAAKKNAARFKKVDRGLFVATTSTK